MLLRYMSYNTAYNLLQKIAVGSGHSIASPNRQRNFVCKGCGVAFKIACRDGGWRVIVRYPLRRCINNWYGENRLLGEVKWP